MGNSLDDSRNSSGPPSSERDNWILVSLVLLLTEAVRLGTWIEPIVKTLGRSGRD